MQIHNQQDYVQALKRHDWQYEYSDDHQVWLRGRDAQNMLLLARQEFDPSWATWNQFCPTEQIRENSHA